MGVSQYSEKQLIGLFQKIHASNHSAIACGIGDDAAVLKFSGQLLATTDSLQEKIHFDWAYTSPYLLGRKFLAVNLSDIAAMGGKARWALMSLAIPSTEKLSRILEFQKGFRSLAREFKVQVVGGDTDHSLKDWKMTCTLLGEAKRPVYRKGALVGDDVWVSGFPGSSALGLELLKARKKAGARFIRAHLNPSPRVQIGAALASQKLAHAMMDVSDGLLIDLERLCEASKLGAELQTLNFKFAPDFQTICKSLAKDPLQLALAGGEDYELLFTAPLSVRNKILTLFSKHKIPVQRIGKIVKAKRVRVFDEKNRLWKPSQKGYSHF